MVLNMLPSQIIEQGWTQNANARNVYGVEVDIDSDEAHQRCARSAVALSFKDDINLCINYEIKLESKIKISIISWNDNPGQTKEKIIQTMKEIEQYMNLRDNQ